MLSLLIIAVFVLAFHSANAFSPSFPHLTSRRAIRPTQQSKLRFSSNEKKQDIIINNEVFTLDADTNQQQDGKIPNDTNIQTNDKKKKFNKQLRRSFIFSTALAGLTQLGLVNAAPPGFERIPTQFIAALGDPTVSSGTNANDWGIWTVDPGPRGVFLRDYTKQLQEKSDIAPAGWKFDKNDWWLEEHGLIMEAPDFPLSPGRYLVTGGRLVTTVLTIGADGKSWKLDKGLLYDVTHLPCRSARYTPGNSKNGVVGSPLSARQKDFPVTPGAEMPPVDGCNKLDYAVLFVIGKEAV